MTSSLIYPALISSIIESTITHPIDVIKIHRQTSQPLIYKVNTLYSGYIPRVFGNIPSRTLFLYSQDYLHNFFNKDDTNTCCKKNYKNYKMSKNIQSIVIPFFAGFAQTLVDTPVEILKMNKVMKVKNTFYYTGFVPHFYRNFIFVLCVYNFKQLGSSNSNLGTNSYLGTAFYGAIGGVVGSYMSHPLDTIKTCIQSNRPHQHFTFNDYMRGCHLRAGMGMFNMFISLYVFEFIKKW
jgi:hypothetical protein